MTVLAHCKFQYFYEKEGKDTKDTVEKIEKFLLEKFNLKKKTSFDPNLPYIYYIQIYMDEQNKERQERKMSIYTKKRKRNIY